MDLEEKKEDILDSKTKSGSVHGILAHSYALTFFFFLVGVMLDFLFRFQFFQHPSFVYTGVILILLGTVLIFWSQKTSKKLNVKDLTKEAFLNGPYSITRSPTHWGLFFLTAGFGIVANAFFIVITSALALWISKKIFLKKEEKILSKKYGEPYREYKKMVRF